MTNLLKTFTFKEADSAEREKALALFRDVYTQDVGHVPEDELDIVACHLIAKTPEGDVVASLRLVGPEQRPFDIERHCDLAPHLSTDAAPGMLGRLSVRHDMRRIQCAVPLHLGMLKLALHFAKAHEITDLFLYAMPHLITFYRGAFFVPLDCSFVYLPLNVRMQVMQLNLRDLECRQTSSRTPRLDFLLSPRPSNFRL